MAPRKQYTDEYKRDAVSLVLNQDYTRSQASRSLGIGNAMLGRWIREFQDDEKDAFRGQGVMTTDQTEVHTLKQEVKRLKAETIILKKAIPLLGQTLQ